MGGYVVNAQALDNLVPQEEMSVNVSRPELADYGPDGTRTWRNTSPAGLRSHHTLNGTEMEMSTRARCCKTPPVDPRMRKSHRCCGTSKENAPSLRLAVTGTVSCLWRRAKAKGKGTAGHLEQRERARKALAKAETGSTGTATTAEPTVIERPNAGNWVWKRLQRAKATNKSKANGKGRRKTLRTTKKKKSPREGTADDAWRVGTMNALTRQSRKRWAHKKGATKRFALLAEPDGGGTQTLQHTRAGSRRTP